MRKKKQDVFLADEQDLLEINELEEKADNITKSGCA